MLASASSPPPVPFRHGALQVPPSLGPIGLTESLVDRVHALGLQVHVWTINERPEMERLLDLGVDAIMTDDVGLLADVLTARGTPLR